jgi:hypothetical protein
VFNVVGLWLAHLSRRRRNPRGGIAWLMGLLTLALGTVIAGAQLPIILQLSA